ncbi:MAG: hypothetical protein AAFX06_12290 [Planctomycetota bacterium]
MTSRACLQRRWMIAIVCIGCSICATASRAEDRLEALLEEFRDYSGAEIVFQRDDLPPARYHDVLKPLDAAGKIAATKVCLKEGRLYPPKFFAEVGLVKIGIFAACASRTTTDTHRRFDPQLGGYRYFGVYNGRDALAAAHYSDGQLAMTFHHEVFHHVDSTFQGETGAWNLGSDDAFYRVALSGQRPYSAPPVASADVELLRDKCFGITLKDYVSAYAVKNSREDQAETARHLMSFLPDALLQTIERPELPGSQRLLHVLNEYEQAVVDGPSFDWFLDVALGRANRKQLIDDPDELLGQMRQMQKDVPSKTRSLDTKSARFLLRSTGRLDTKHLSGTQASQLMDVAADLTRGLLRERLRPDPHWVSFEIRGREDKRGVNHTLRHDIAQLGRDARRLGLILSVLRPIARESDEAAILATQMRMLRGIARYYVFIKRFWSVTPGTTRVFESTRQEMVGALIADEGIRDVCRSLRLIDLATRITSDGRL